MAALWVGIFVTVLVWSASAPKDYPTWWLEVMPALIGFVVVVGTRRRFRLTTLAYVLILAHSIVLMVGGHYTYAEVPLFDTFREWFGWQRNNYDKVGHFMQGFAPALIARELVVRLDIINGAVWRNFFILCFVLALAAFYELLEWWTALLFEEAADAFLGTQGYLWDTQSDMGWALLGASLSLLLLRPLHDAQLSRIEGDG